jgi:hypothetical protein
LSSAQASSSELIEASALLTPDSGEADAACCEVSKLGRAGPADADPGLGWFRQPAVPDNRVKKQVSGYAGGLSLGLAKGADFQPCAWNARKCAGAEKPRSSIRVRNEICLTG